ncbi:PIN domain-containing protein [Amylibacter marinus]|uniref:PIN domain-containing protein n=1 Tax=Amylibacter marinus TaxID=1475483 RepID=A0ABQ5VUG7_9RHOB|nr:PIN domain-containing protein [Amylibacter marinus]GLQ34821.1 PIN domain-containing protein [Amylibacter marinus]
MRVLLDTCVLYPSVLRSILLDVASQGLFMPLWSERILDEWRHTSVRNHVEAEATIEIALLSSKWRESLVQVDKIDPNLHLPDDNDIHVLQAAITGKADELLTANLKDFPTDILSKQGLIRRAPDDFLLELAHANREAVLSAVEKTRKEAIRRSGQSINNRKMLKNARLPRLAKFIAG